MLEWQTIWGIFKGVWSPIATIIIKNWHKLFGKNLCIVKTGHKFDNYWCPGSFGKEQKPLVQMHIKFIVTNLIDKPVVLTGATLKGYELDEFDSHLLVKDKDSDCFGSYPIAPHDFTTGIYTFMSSKIPDNLDSQTMAVTMVLHDNFGKTYKLNNVRLARAGQVS